LPLACLRQGKKEEKFRRQAVQKEGLIREEHGKQEEVAPDAVSGSRRDKNLGVEGLEVLSAF